ncbi:ribosomal-protein-alanine N-acetyltransferase [Planomicrobium stackebrandtii]|uniref:Ribosomal-protein-alanine N-acetyltransferase n=1 Tax=Planomicrobium stackebrandtii TaxID=253160 RepID=A0ABU0GVB0_9BACL|nr:GNAT family N-acetyltransferase [Planomicrobium stackebrandtii]MDQ0429301.1 ribosomal-protein-alanine N-acetyltransferase [Planomicrobium stackebrandtii]
MYPQSDRLEFRPYKDEDFHFLWSLLSDPEMIRYIGKGQTRDRSEALKFLYWIYRSYQENFQSGLLLLVRKSDGRRIGHAGLVTQTVEKVDELEVGYWIAKEFWGQGYAKEAARALRDYGLQQLGRSRLISLIQRDNRASQKVAQHIGMAMEKEIHLSGRKVWVFAIEKEENDGISTTGNRKAALGES